MNALEVNLEDGSLLILVNFFLFSPPQGSSMLTNTLGPKSCFFFNSRVQRRKIQPKCLSCTVRSSCSYQRAQNSSLFILCIGQEFSNLY